MYTPRRDSRAERQNNRVFKSERSHILWWSNCSSTSVIPRRWLEPAFLSCAVALTRFAFRSHYLYDIDSVNFGLALDRFDPHAHQPHPPGYFLYVCLGRLFNAWFHDANTSLVALSIAASCATVVLVWMLAREWFGSRAATCAGIIFLVSPLAWFHGTVALTYSVEAFFSALVGYLCWRVYAGSFGFVVPAAVALGIAAGIRPSGLLFLAPLFLFSLLRAPRKEIVRGLAALAVTLLAWFVPMIRACGGLDGYFGPLISLWRMVPSTATVFNSSPANSIARICTIGCIFGLCFGAAAILLFRRSSGSSAANRRKAVFTWIWIGPALLFFSFVFLKFVNSGYLLLLLPPICAWLGFRASEAYTGVTWPQPLKIAIAGLGIALNVLIFLCAPVYCSYREVRRFEKELDGIRSALPQIASSKDTVIIGFDSHFLGYRHAGYYLPDYLTAQFPEVRLTEGTRVFTMQHRDTRLASALPVNSYVKFVLFPLPSEENEYREYVREIRGRFHPGDLHTVYAGGREFITGEMADLSRLIPVAATLDSPCTDLDCP